MILSVSAFIYAFPYQNLTLSSSLCLEVSPKIGASQIEKLENKTLLQKFLACRAFSIDSEDAIA
jgi:hypothetical protein